MPHVRWAKEGRNILHQNRNHSVPRSMVGTWMLLDVYPWEVANDGIASPGWIEIKAVVEVYRRVDESSQVEAYDTWRIPAVHFPQVSSFDCKNLTCVVDFARDK
jgi:hypothetical protein